MYRLYILCISPPIRPYPGIHPMFFMRVCTERKLRCGIISNVEIASTTNFFFYRYRIKPSILRYPTQLRIGWLLSTNTYAYLTCIFLRNIGPHSARVTPVFFFFFLFFSFFFRSQQVGLQGTPHVLLDPNTLSTDGTSALTGVDFAKDGKKLAYGISKNGSDW